MHRHTLLTASLILMGGYAHAQTVQHAPPSEVLAVHDYVAAVSAERIEADIRTLAGFGTRHTLSETASDTRGIGAARRWIHDEFERISAACGGCLEVMYVSDTISGETRIPEPTDVVSVVAIQRGRIDPDRYVLMSGDIDSRVTDPLDGTSDSPGANDNASGMAGVLEAARVLSQHEFDGSIIYTGLSGEEQGLFGGQILAAHALEAGWRIKAGLNNDMSGEVDSASRNLARMVDRTADQYIPNLDVMMVYRLDRFGRGGHHRPFNAVGIPGVRIMETNEHYDRQHQDLRTEDGRVYGDTVEGVDFDYAAKLTALNIAVMAQIAGAPPIPANVTIEGAVQPSTHLSWALAEGPAAANLAGYRVHWRLTDQPQWTHSRFVGPIGEYTLENVVIDNYYFGVSAVALDGSETPVVFPGAAGSFGE